MRGLTSGINVNVKMLGLKVRIYLSNKTSPQGTRAEEYKK